jgi:hypothetical protein
VNRLGVRSEEAVNRIGIFTDKTTSATYARGRILEGRFLGVRFSDAPGFMRETVHDALMERVDEQGNVLGFSILGVSRFHKSGPLKQSCAPANGDSRPNHV